MNGTIGAIYMGGWNFAPRNMAYCNGQLLAIAQNTALFSILGTIYGGDGRTSFGLPDCRGRMIIGDGNGPGLSDRREGQKAGVEQVTLTAAQLPNHTHTVTGRMHGSTAMADTQSPESEIFATVTYNGYAVDAGAADETLAAGSVGGTLNNTGSSQPHNNMPPYQTISVVICTQGTFPSRN